MQATLSFLSTFYQLGHSFWSASRPWLIAVCLLVTAVLLLPATGQLENSHQVLLKYLPYGLSIIVILLGQQFVQGRIAMAAVNLLIGYSIIQLHLQAPLNQDNTRAYFTLLSFYWPLNFFIIYWLPERKLISPLGCLLAAVISLQIASTYIFVHYVPDYAQTLNQYLALYPFGQDPEDFMGNWHLPLASTLTLLIISLVLLTHTLIKRDRSHCVLFASMIACTLICASFDSNSISSLFSSLIACALLVTLLFNSHDLAFLDELTGLPGRRALMNELKHCGKHYCIVMADIDFFKKFNDTHGHDTGDDVLRVVAQELAKVRGGGTAFRYGGEEFTLLFKRKHAEEAEPFIERIRQDIADYPLIIRDQENRPKIKNKRSLKSKASTTQVQVTVSFGIAQRQAEQRPEDVMKSADQALYRAKEQGRNCIAV
ncbi:Sensory transduction protein kinase [Oleispira antarctica RB-8]|uniref:diguanylate cyclase n=1 Tax=Oleispira antarctica RB-8 TaxID=698738 RepID=R4YTH5_OLEAN|nr:Sensory transduction protein kinase [Oleispira antarctica RB-8]